MIGHANVFLLADYYQMSSLRELAVTKLRDCLKTFEAKGFGDMIAHIYGSEEMYSAQELKDAIDEELSQHLNGSRKDEFFIQEYERLPILKDEARLKFIELRLQKLEKVAGLLKDLADRMSDPDWIKDCEAASLSMRQLK